MTKLFFIAVFLVCLQSRAWFFEKSEDKMTDESATAISVNSKESVFMGKKANLMFVIKGKNNLLIFSAPTGFKTNKDKFAEIELRIDKNPRIKTIFFVGPDPSVAAIPSSQKSYTSISSMLKSGNKLLISYLDVFSKVHVLEFDVSGFSESYSKLKP